MLEFCRSGKVERHFLEVKKQSLPGKYGTGPELNNAFKKNSNTILDDEKLFYKRKDI